MQNEAIKHNLGAQNDGREKQIKEGKEKYHGEFTVILLL